MQYTGKLFYPRGTALRLDLDDLSPIQGELAFQVYGRLKRAMNKDHFAMEIDPAGFTQPLILGFVRVGQTAAYAAFARQPAEQLEAVMALLPRLDNADDQVTLDHLRADARLAMIDPDDWQDAHDQPGPVAATFFTNEPALNDPFIHGLMSLTGAAFLDRLGLLQ